MAFRHVGLNLRGYTTAALTDLLTRFGAQGTQEVGAIRMGNCVRNTTTGVAMVWNGVAFVAGLDSGAPVAPVNTVLPTITGTLTAGQTLTAVAGTWTGTPAPLYLYQWNKGGVAIAGATSSTYVAATAGAYTVTVYGSNGVGAPVPATSIVSTVV